MKDNNDFGVVGNIKIAEPKRKKKKSNKKTSPLWIKIFVWLMFIAMLASFLAPLIYYLVSIMTAE